MANTRFPSFLRVAGSSSPPAANPQVERMIGVSDPTRSPIIRGRTASFQLACGQLTAGAFVGHAPAARSSLSQSVVPRDCCLASLCVAGPPACFALLIWKASGDPKSGERSDLVAPRARTVGRELPRGPPPHGRVTQERDRPPTLIPPPSKRGGRSFGAALSEVAIRKHRPLRPALRPAKPMSRSPVGGFRRFRGRRQLFGAGVMP